MCPIIQSAVAQLIPIKPTLFLALASDVADAKPLHAQHV